MNKVFFLMVFSLAWNLTLLTAQETTNHLNDSSKAAPEALSWDKTVQDFGQIPQGIPVEVGFTLTNNSKEALHINSVKTTCGCTVASYSKDPILPGESTAIIATFNAKNEGPFNKTVKVYTNLNLNAITLRLKGEVVSEKN